MDVEGEGPEPVQKATKGEIFYTNFRSQIDENLVSDFGSYSKIILDNIAENSLIFRIFMSLLERQVIFRKEVQKKLPKLVEFLVP
jgi:hypothetical protein